MRILMATYSFGPRFGGAERQAARLAQELINQGHHVEHVCADLETRQDALGDITVNRLQGFVPHKGGRKATWKRYGGRLVRFMRQRRGDFDLVHCHGAFDASSLFIGAAAPRLGLPTVLKHASGDEYRILKRRTRLPKAFARPLHGRFTTHVTNNRPISLELRDDPLFGQRITQFIPNGVPLPDKTVSYHEEGQAPKMVCVSNFNKNKNQEALVRAWPRVQELVPGARLAFAGTGSLLEHCKAVATELGVADTIDFEGFVQDVPALLQSSQVFVFPSRHKEGMPNALLEALANGLPSVVLTQPAVVEVIHHDEQGIVITEDDPDTVAEAIAAVLEPQTWQRMSQSARQRAETEYAMAAVAHRYLDLYRRTLAAHP